MCSTILPPAAGHTSPKHYLVAYAMFVMLLLVFCPSGIIGLDKRFTAARSRAAAPTAE